MFDPQVAPVGEISNTLGCGGIGQSEFTSGLFNMPETFQKFQQDINSTLSKNILSMNFVMPQTSALFDQLNNIGNQRFDQFQRGCNVTQLQQDAKQNYLQACVEKLTPERKTLIEEDNEDRPQNAKIPENQIGPMAYAQAWEICTNQSVSNTMAMEVRNEKLTAFYEQTRQAERVDQAIRPLLCDLTQESLTNENAGCWIKYLIPQVRICLGDNLENGCTDGPYGVKEPIVSMQRLFDAMRFVMEDEVIGRRIVSFTADLDNKKVGPSARRSAAIEASLRMSTATLTREASTTTTIVGTELSTIPDKSVLDYQLNYLSCKNLDVLSPVRQYHQDLKKRLDTGVTLSEIAVFTQTNYKNIVTKMKLVDGEGGEASDKDKNAVAALLQTALGCTANQSIPVFDPNIMASLQAQCSNQDQSAFYAIAGYDVSMAATRDVYRYVGLKLKQAYARLLTEAMVPVSDTTNTSVSPTLSPELNAKFANVVKDVMIPYIESQIARLDELSATRGVFGQRVREIYNSKTGCPSAPVKGGRV